MLLPRLVCAAVLTAIACSAGPGAGPDAGPDGGLIGSEADSNPDRASYHDLASHPDLASDFESDGEVDGDRAADRPANVPVDGAPVASPAEIVIVCGVQFPPVLAQDAGGGDAVAARDANEAEVAAPVCGNGRIEIGESCDPPTTVGRPYCGNDCNFHDRCTDCVAACAGTRSCDAFFGDVGRACWSLRWCLGASLQSANDLDPLRCYCGLADTSTCKAGGAVGSCRPEFERAAGTTDGAAIIAMFSDATSPVGAAITMTRCSLSPSCSGSYANCVPNLGMLSKSCPAVSASPLPPDGTTAPNMCRNGTGSFEWTTAPAPRAFALWSAGPADTWLRGDLEAGPTWHWDGTSWNQKAPPWGCAELPDWAAGPDNLWFKERQLRRWNGVAMTTILDFPAWAVWGAGANDVWAAADGRLFHWDGNVVTERPAFPDRIEIRALGGLASDDVFAFASGQNQTSPYAGYSYARHWDGRQWSEPTDPKVGALRVWQLWQAGPHQLWALTFDNTLWLYDGTRWAQQTSLPSVGSLSAVAGSGPNDIWLAGDRGVLAHYDGAVWSAEDTGAASLSAINSEGPGVVWAIGGEGGFEATPTRAVFHRDRGCAGGGKPTAYGGGPFSSAGLVWTPQERITADGLWASGPDDVWLTTGTTVEHWNGSQWATVLSNRTCGAGAQRAFTEVWGSGPNDVWVGVAGATLQHWDGQSWQERSPPRQALNYDSYIDRFQVIWGTGPADVWAVRRNFDTRMDGPNSVFHWDGNAWTPRSIPPVLVNAPTPDTFMVGRLWGSGPNDVWATGSIRATFVVSPSFTYFGLTGFAHWDGAAWTVNFDLNDATARGGSSNGIWGTSADNIWASGTTDFTKPIAWHYDGATWKVVDGLATDGRNQNIWGTAPNDVWFGGPGGLLHFDGTSLSDVNLHIARVDRGISVSSQDVWIEGRYTSRGAVLLHGQP